MRKGEGREGGRGGGRERGKEREFFSIEFDTRFSVFRIPVSFFFFSLLQYRWHSIKPNKDELSLDITSASADLLTSLRYHLSFLDLHLSPSLTIDTFETLTTRIDKLLVTEVHTCTMYNKDFRNHLFISFVPRPLSHFNIFF